MCYEERSVEDINFDCMSYEDLTNLYLMYKERFDHAHSDLLYILRVKRSRLQRERKEILNEVE